MSTHSYMKIIVMAAMMTLFLGEEKAFANSAQLALTPGAIILNDDDVTATITLLNKGNATGAYRIDLIEMVMKEDGSTDEATPEEEKNIQFSAKQMLRISPRSMTVSAGDSQNIHVVIRRPRDLADGEYKAYIHFTLIETNAAAGPRSDDEAADNAKKGATVGAGVHFAINYPITVRHGVISHDVKITNATFHQVKNELGNLIPGVEMVINRTGNSSSIGTIDITYTDTKGIKTIVKHIPVCRIYRSLDHIRLNVPLDIPDGVVLGKGSLTVHYADQEDGKLSSEMTIPL